MVYCGKPSKSCAECRKTRRKCDRAVPSCSQCIRAGKACQGYRDPTTLLFRDQTEKTAVQVQISKLPRHRGPIPSLSKSTHPVSQDMTVVPKPRLDAPTLATSIPPNLMTSMDERATFYFFHNYVLHAEDAGSFTGFKYVKNIYSEELVGPTMTDAIIALGLAGLANSLKDPRIMMNATKRYNGALKAINKALECPEQAKSDQTLGTVILLGLYETNTCSTIHNVGAWRKHILGAATLMTLRGPEQLKSPIGQQLFVQLRTQLVVHCLQARAGIPRHITEWSKALPAFGDKTTDDGIARAFITIVTDFSELRATMREFHDYSDPGRIIPAVLAIDARLAAWHAELPQHYFYNIELISSSLEEVFGDHYHTYRTIFVATLWNHYRIVRILANEIILDQLLYLERLHAQGQQQLQDDPSLPSRLLPTPFNAQILTTRSLLMQLMQEVCASVPYFLGPSSVMHKALIDPSSASPIPSLKAVFGNLLIWPLFSVACIDFCSPMMRSWIQGRLEKIAELLGVRQAEALAQLLQMNMEVIVEDETHIGSEGCPGSRIMG